MNSNVEQAPNAGAQAMAEEALLKEIGCRASSPTQAVKVCQILGLASRENIRRVREIAKNKNEIASEAENKKPEEKKMEEKWGNAHYSKIAISLVRKLMERAIKKEEVDIVKVESGGAYYKCLQPEDRIGNYDYVVAIMPDGNFHAGPGYNNVTIYVLNEKYRQLARRFAQLYEKKTGENTVILKEY